MGCLTWRAYLDAELNDMSSRLEQRRQSLQCIQDIREHLINLFGPFISSHKSPLLIDLAYHSNFGDNLLAYGEVCLLHALGKNYTECGLVQSGRQNEKCSILHYASSDVALWHAGGNWGDMWTAPHNARLASFTEMQSQNISVLGMPQSLNYSSIDKENWVAAAPRSFSFLIIITNEIIKIYHLIIIIKESSKLINYQIVLKTNQ